MSTMKAAVVSSFDEPPHYQAYDVPLPQSQSEIVVDVLAAGLHPRVKSGAAGIHYSSSGRLPMIPGVDGVGRREDGQLIYFVADDAVSGTMAEKTVVNVRRAIELPRDVDVVKVAAAMNPAMSAWVALRRRVPLQPGQSALVLGATGNAGSMAVQIAKRLGAARVIGAGRDLTRLRALTALGADVVVQLGVEDSPARLADAAANVDVVIDYLWGTPAQEAIMTLLTHREDRSRELNWIQIGAVAGPTMELPSVALRSANVRLQGNGQGAVSTATYLAELPSLVEEIDSGAIEVVTDVQSLSDVENVWKRATAPGVRTVFVPFLS
jgi:NADPH:quinone reductase-like Zn-dependent oxidoreductase